MKKLTTLGCLIALGLSTAPAKAEDMLKDMISPVSQPTNFEDPRHSTELRPIFVTHKFQEDFVTSGGNVQLYALQARFKLTDDLSIIATKDGFLDLNPDAVVPEDTGLANLAAGVKYSVYRSDDTIVTTGLRYEAPTGKEEVLQGQGDGLINPFVSVGYTFCDWNFIAGSGMRVRIDDSDSSFWDLNLHADYKIGNFYPLVELGYIQTFQAGSRLPIADEGYDVFNLGSSGAAGKRIVTATVGARYRVMDDLDVGVGYDFPLDRGTGARAIDWRLTADLIYRFSLT